MSHDFNVRCRCGAETQDWNHAGDELVEAVRKSYPLLALKVTPWDIGSILFHGYKFEGLAAFLANHFSHGGFTVCGEYSSDIPVPVKPECPPDVYESMCLGRLKEEVSALETRIAEMKKGLQ